MIVPTRFRYGAHSNDAVDGNLFDFWWMRPGALVMQKKIFSNAALCHDFGRGRWKGVGEEEGESVEEEKEHRWNEFLVWIAGDTSMILSLFVGGTDVECWTGGL